MISVFGVAMAYGSGEKRLIKPKRQKYLVTCKQCGTKKSITPNRIETAKFCSGMCREEFKRSGKTR